MSTGFQVAESGGATTHCLRRPADVPGARRRAVARYFVVLSSLAVLLIAACRFNLSVTGPEPVDRHGDSRATASPVDAQSTTAGHLGAGDTDYFRVRVERLSYLEVETTGSTDTAGVLEDRWGQPFAADDDSGSGTNFTIRHRLAPDDYYVRVSAGGSGVTGDYTLVIRRTDVDEHGSRRWTATYVAIDSLIRGYLRVGDTDYFQTVVADERTLTVFSTGLTDTVAVLEDAAGRVLDADDDGGDGLNFLIRERVRPGVYFVRVQGYHGRDRGHRLSAEGEYYLSIK